MSEGSGCIASIADGPKQDFTMKAKSMLQRLELNAADAEWLEEVRKIPCEIAAELGFVSTKNGLAFEYRKNGLKVFHKIRIKTRDANGVEGKTFRIEPSGQEMLMFNEDCLSEPCSPDMPLIICEGELDAASWLTSGATRVVSVPTGAPDKETKYEEGDTSKFAYLWEGDALKPGFDNFKKIILATDNDKAGRILRDELAVRLGRSRCFVVTYPTGCKDANEVLMKHENGSEILMHMLDEAQPIVPSKLVPIMDIPDRGVRVAYSTGWGRMDDHLKIVMPELVVVTGVPNSGKSQWSLALCMNLARVHGLRGAIFQFEDSVERNKHDILRYAKSWLSDPRWQETIRTPEYWAREMFYSISPKEDEDDKVNFDLKWLQSAIAEAVYRHGCKWVLIDPWNEIEHVWNVRENETNYTNSALRELKRLARMLQIAIIIVAHPSKGADSKSIDELSLYDVSGSAAWKNKADHGIIIARDKQDKSITFVKVDKSKDWRTMGEPGTVRMQFNRDTASFVILGQ